MCVVYVCVRVRVCVCMYVFSEEQEMKLTLNTQSHTIHTQLIHPIPFHTSTPSGVDPPRNVVTRSEPSSLLIVSVMSLFDSSGVKAAVRGS